MRKLSLLILVIVVLLLTPYLIQESSEPYGQEASLAQLYDEIDSLQRQIDECKRIYHPYATLIETPDARKEAQQLSKTLQRMHRRCAKRYNHLFESSPPSSQEDLLQRGLPKYIPPCYE